jgi:ABC-2 type transport system ATP-binding protein
MSGPVNRNAVLYAEDLTRHFDIHEREKGLAAAAKSLFWRRRRQLVAVNRVSFQVEAGEVVAFLGPNGAGKTTTIKMLCGLLYPTGGEVRVLGHAPFKRQHEFLRQISLVMGRRNQLIWDIPAMDSFEFFRAMYSVPRQQFKALLDELTELLELAPLLLKPVRVLSMGERMKCELAGALLHRPSVLFLDEPTIGLDVVAQHKFRQFIAEYNRRYGATVLLTSHYMGDVEALCERVIFIQAGRILFAGKLRDMVERILPYKEISLTLREDAQPVDFNRFGTVITQMGRTVKLRVPKGAALGLIPDLMRTLPLEDLTIADPPASDMVKAVYAGEFEA